MKRYSTELAVFITAAICAIPDAFIWNLSIWSNVLCSFIFLFAVLLFDKRYKNKIDEKSACGMMLGSWVVTYVIAFINKWLVGTWSAPWLTIVLALAVGLIAWWLARQAGYFQNLGEIQPFVWLASLLLKIPGGEWLADRIRKLYAAESAQSFLGTNLEIVETEPDANERVIGDQTVNTVTSLEANAINQQTSNAVAASTVDHLANYTKCGNCLQKTWTGKRCLNCGRTGDPAKGIL